MMSDNFALPRIQQAIFLFQAGDDAFHRHRKIFECDGVTAATCRRQRRLIDQIGQIGARETGGQSRDLFWIGVGSETDFLDVHAEDLLAPHLIRSVHQHLAIETSGAQ